MKSSGSQLHAAGGKNVAPIAVLAITAGGSAAICFIPAVGQAACVAAVAIVAVAFYYLTEYGRCPASKPNLRSYVWGNKTGCYK